MQIAAVVVALGGAAIVGSAYAENGQSFSQVERGHYLTDAADCAGCHTMRGGKPFAGGLPVETPFGYVVAPNITPDRETGIGAWTDDDFDGAVRHGKLPNGSRLYPAMPYVYYTKMSRDDVIAIRSYLNTIDPVHNDVVSNKLPFPFNIRTAMRFWDALYFTPGDFKPDPSKSAEWNRGAYLVQGPAHCGACHTPKSFLGGDKPSRAMQGYVLQGWLAPDITSGNGALKQWSTTDIAEYLRSGHNAVAAATGPMADEVAYSSSKMTDADLTAIATYLKDISSSAMNSAKDVPEAVMLAGGAVYRDLCSACHTGNGKGIPHLFPDLTESASVRSQDPTTVLRVILQGAQTVATDPEPTSPSMPAFGWQLNDEQIAALATFVRNSWGNHATATTATDVRKERVDLSSRTQ